MLIRKKPVKEEENIKELKVQTKNNNKNFLRVFLLKRFWIVLLLSLSGIVLFLYFIFSFFTSSSEGVLEYHINKDTNQLNFFISSAEVNFIVWDKDYIKINYQLNDSSFTLDQLEVEENSDSKSWSFFWKKDFSLVYETLPLPSFKIYIPSEGFELLFFDMIYGDLSINNLKEKEIRGSLMVGDINLKDNFDLHGDIQLGWGTFDTYGEIKNKEWNASTGFSGVIPTESGKDLNLSIFMGSLD